MSELHIEDFENKPQLVSSCNKASGTPNKVNIDDLLLGEYYKVLSMFESDKEKSKRVDRHVDIEYKSFGNYRVVIEIYNQGTRSEGLHGLIQKNGAPLKTNDLSIVIDNTEYIFMGPKKSEQRWSLSGWMPKNYNKDLCKGPCVDMEKYIIITQQPNSSGGH